MIVSLNDNSYTVMLELVAMLPDKRDAVVRYCNKVKLSLVIIKK